MNEPAPQTKPSSPPPKAKTAPPSPDAIPVKKIVFERPGGHDLPGGHGLSQIKARRADEPTNKGWYELAFEPRLRKYRITFHPPGNQPVQVACVPENWGWYEPDE